MIYSPSSYNELPDNAGVYRFLDEEGKVLYVGKAKNLKSRVSSYFMNTSMLGPKTKVLVSHIKKIQITIVESELEALLLEAFYIKKFRPRYNIMLKDNKSYVRIKIAVKDPYPAVLLARREDDGKSVYFGPYPSSSSVKLVLKTIRKIFPFQSIPRHPKRICLYHHLGLCVCPPVFDSPELRKEYRKYITGIIRILEGESKKVMKELEKQRDAFSKDESYEEALAMQKKIDALSLITTPFHKPVEYDVNPNLQVDLRFRETEQLRETLNNAGYHIEQLHRIECYDISNIQGTNATGSMVVFVDGEKESSQYRRFKIRRDWEKKDPKTKKKVKDLPNDFAMMNEMLKRRFTHDEWDSPDLLIIDGGKGQVSSAMAALAYRGVSYPIIGLAKREETIVLPNDWAKGTDEGTYTEILLPKNSPALHLITRIRDEAHRFAITYHRLLRSKAAIEK